MKHILKRLWRAELATAAFGFLVGLFGNIAANWVAESAPVLNVFLWAFGLLAVVMLVLYMARRESTTVVIRAPQSLRSEQGRMEYACRGLIVFVSLYVPQKGTPADKLSVDERLAAAGRLEYQCLNLEQSNFAPTIAAITGHASRLEHCWLVSTVTQAGGDQTGSYAYVPVLVKYLREEKKLRCRFYGDVDKHCAVSLEEDVLVTSHTRDLVERIFREAGRLNLEEHDIAADFTGGLRSMVQGLILACLDGNRRVEFVGTHYDGQGRPTGELYPIIYSFEPRVVEKG